MAFAICYLIHANVFARSKAIALVGGSPTLEHATKTALRPWHIDVVSLPVDAELRNESSAAYAELAAHRHGVAAVVWFGGNANKGSYRIWLYDVSSRSVTMRELKVRLPLTDADAASVALSIKTMLMHSELVPIEVRLPPPAGKGAPMRPDNRSAPDLAPDLGVQPRHAVYAELGAAAEPAAALGPEWRIGLGWRFTPARGQGRYVVAAGLDLGRGAAFRKSGVDGRFSSHAVRAAVGWRVVQSRRFVLAVSFGGSARLVTLRGELIASGDRARDWRVNPSADAAVFLGIPVSGRIILMGRLGLAYNLRRERYVLEERPLMRLSTVDVESAAMLVVAMPF